MFRIAWVSTIANELLHASQQSRGVLRAVPGGFDIEVFSASADCGQFGERVPTGQLLFHHSRLAERNRAKRFDAVLTQIEDAGACNFARLAAEVWPSVVLAHDVNLNRMFQQIYEYTTAPTELNDLAIRLFGADAPKLGDYHVKKWPVEIFDKRYVARLTDPAIGTLGQSPLIAATCCAHAAALRGAARTTTATGAAVAVLPKAVDLGSPEACKAKALELSGRLATSPHAFVAAFHPSHLLADTVVRTLEGLAAAAAREPSKPEIVLLWLYSDRRELRLAEGQTRLFSEAFPESRVRIELVSVQSAAECCAAVLSSDAVIAVRNDELRSAPLEVAFAQLLEVPLLQSAQGPSVEMSQQFAAGGNRLNLCVPVGISHDGSGVEHWIASSIAELRSVARRSELNFDERFARGVALSTGIAVQFWSELQAKLTEHGAHIAQALRNREHRVHTAADALLTQLAAELAANSAQPQGSAGAPDVSIFGKV